MDGSGESADAQVYHQIRRGEDFLAVFNCLHQNNKYVIKGITMKLSPCSGLLAYCYGNSWPAELRRILMWTPSTSRCSSCRGGGCCSPSSALMPCECAHIQYAEVNLNGKPVRVEHFFSKGFLILIAEHLLLWYVKCWPISERVTGSVKKTFSLDTVEFFQFSLEQFTLELLPITCQTRTV